MRWTRDEIINHSGVIGSIYVVSYSNNASEGARAATCIGLFPKIKALSGGVLLNRIFTFTAAQISFIEEVISKDRIAKKMGSVLYE